ncbi:damage-control phosphatase ARMT1 family protein [Nocardia carnea]|uniref:damage-control phosphatase ARMT1 family protein n=1 Tax=Nocardia carnea TaxID=37328 RepID=UPI002453BFD9|nr:damage-control phosphatase ARMT1 family protein [Nocardia carnea]
MESSTSEPRTIVSTEPDSFAWRVLTRRHPAIIEQVGEAHPYPPEIRDRLDALREHITGTVQPPPDGSAGKSRWDRWGSEMYGQRWLDVPFLWAESYFYHLLLDAVGYFGPGPWRGIDPFTRKGAELADPALDAELSAADKHPVYSPRERTTALLHAALWGNRADLGFRLSGSPAAGGDAPGRILDDQTAEVAHHLETLSAGTICLIADNAGRELIPDLFLIDHLLRLHPDIAVDLHLKPRPYYVSDATTADLLATLQRLAGVSGAARATAARLGSALGTGRVRVRTHEFYCAPLSFHHLPADLRDGLARADTVILKGDLNYRRLVGDCQWPATTSFSAVTEYFPSRVIALRTLKCDVAVGIDAGIVAALEDTEPDWRVSGSHGVVQMGASTD